MANIVIYDAALAGQPSALAKVELAEEEPPPRLSALTASLGELSARWAPADRIYQMRNLHRERQLPLPADLVACAFPDCRVAVLRMTRRGRKLCFTVERWRRATFERHWARGPSQGWRFLVEFTDG